MNMHVCDISKGLLGVYLREQSKSIPLPFLNDCPYALIDNNYK